jgi:hypothetical protein
MRSGFMCTSLAKEESGGPPRRDGRDGRARREHTQPGSAEARRALEFRPLEVRTANTPHGESPREGDFCRPGCIEARLTPRAHHS